MAWVWHLLAAMLALSLASPLTKRFPRTGECTGACEGKLHDPAVVYREETDTYYRFTTNNKINIATAPHLSGPWTDQGPALPEGSSIDLPGQMDLWAPDVFNNHGTFYLYYSVSAMGSKNSDIGVATSDTMDSGSWLDHGSLGIPQNDDYNRIDGNLFQHSAGSAFLLNFGSFWGQLYQVPMADPPLRVAGDAFQLAKNDSARPGLTPGSTEGGYLFQWADYYYLFFSSGNCCNELEEGLAPPGEEYKVMVCRSFQSSGGFVDQLGRDCLNQNGGTLVLGSHDDVYAPGGQGVMWDPQQDSVVMYYHYVRPSVGYAYEKIFFGWNKLDFSSGWPVVV